MNPYLVQIERVLPRILSLIDRDPFSPSYGVGDRLYGSWKLMDFANGSFQGLASGLSRLYQNQKLKHFDEEKLLDWVDSLFRGTEKIRRKNGSMEEAFPYESSFCVTALVAFDLLTSIENLSKNLDSRKKDSYLKIIAPLIDFLKRHDEKHGFISNHLATAAAALCKWELLTQDAKAGFRSKFFLERILSFQDSEGWYLEYEGADPGYQTLCLNYLADIYKMNPDPVLKSSLENSIKFLNHFAHPDGSFGGIYGSRNTRFYFPGGIEFLAQNFPEARALTQFMSRSILNHNVVTLDCMDELNLIPMFNSYAWAATLSPQETLQNDEELLPCLRMKKFTQIFPNAGFYIRGGPQYYTVVSIHKGGVIAHYQRSAKKMLWNCGSVLKNKKNNSLYSSQSWKKNPYSVNEEGLRLEASYTKMLHRLPTPFQFIILRILNITLMRNVFLGNFIKKILVRMLITQKKDLPLKLTRKIKWKEDGGLEVVDKPYPPSMDYVEAKAQGVFKSIHMASSGYWQRDDP